MEQKIPAPIKFWIPNEKYDHDTYRTMVSFTSVQFGSLIVIIPLVVFLYWVKTNIAATTLFIYGVINFFSLIIVKLNRYQIAQIIGAVNAAITLTIVALFTGREGSVWVYLGVSLWGGHFFMSNTKRNQILSDAAIIICFLAYLIIEWFQWIPNEVTPENKLYLSRFGLFNMVYGVVIIFGFVSFFYQKSMEYRALLEKQAIAIHEQFLMVSSILNNMKQAIFAINPDKKIVAPVSQFTHEIFNKTLEGENIHDVLFSDPSKKELWSKVDSSFNIVFGEDDLNWQMTHSNFPKELDIKVGERDKSLKINYNDMRNEKGELEKVLMVVEDVTELRNLEEKIQLADEARQREMKIVQQVYSLDPVVLERFFKNTDKFIVELESEIQKNNSTQLITLFKRNFHTLKGNVRALGFLFYSSLVHECENILSEISTQSQMDLGEALKKLLNDVKNVHSEYFEVTKKFVHFNSGVVSQAQKNTRKLIFSEANFNRFQSRLAEKLKDHKQITVDEFETEIQKLNEISISELTASKEVLVQEISQSLKKKINFISAIDFITVNENTALIIDEVLTHALRNAVDHGIETELERKIKNKPEVGTIELKTVLYPDEFEIQIRDDGQGIDTKALFEKAIKMKLLTEDQMRSMSDDDKLNLIFYDGLSIKESVTEYSGRGIGNGIIKSKLESIGGRIMVHSELNKGTVFSIYIKI